MGVKVDKGIINFGGWDKGVANSPETGIANIVNCNISSIPGVFMTNKKLLFNSMPIIFIQEFTAEPSTDIITVTNTFSYTLGDGTDLDGTGVPVTLTTTGTLPAGLAVDTVYYLIAITSTTFKLAGSWTNALAGNGLDITDTGTGTHEIVIVQMGSPKHIVYDKTNDDYYMLGDDGRVWQLGLFSQHRLVTGNTLTNANGNGLIVWKDYLFVFSNDEIETLGPLSGSRLWTTSWKTLNTPAGTNNPHYVIASQDDKMYWVDGRFIGSLIEDTAPFNPNTGASFIYNSQALDLPTFEIGTYLEELDINLVIGTQSDKIYPWDRVSDTFEFPISINEKNVASMKTVGNLVYILAGTKGRISITDGVSVEQVAEISESLTEAFLDTNTVTFGGIDKVNEKLIFGVKTIASNEADGVWSYNLVSGAIVLENTVSQATGSVVAFPEVIRFVSGDQYFAGYNVGGNGFIDLLGTTQYYDNFEAILDTDYVRVGNKKNPFKASHIEIELERDLGTSESFKVFYRTSLTNSFTLIDTFTGVGIKSFDKDFGIDFESIQLRVGLASSSESNKSLVRIKNLIVYKG